MNIDSTVQPITLQFSDTAGEVKPLDEVIAEMLDADSLTENEFVEFSDKRTMATKVKTFYGLLVIALQAFVNSVNSGRTLDKIEVLLGKSFDKLSEAQDAYALENDGKKFRLADSDVLTEPEVVKGIITSKNVVNSPYLSIAQRLAKDTKRFAEYQNAYSDATAIKLLQLGINRWLQSSHNPHREFVLSDFFGSAKADKAETAKIRAEKDAPATANA